MLAGVEVIPEVGVVPGSIDWLLEVGAVATGAELLPPVDPLWPEPDAGLAVLLVFVAPEPASGPEGAGI